MMSVYLIADVAAGFTVIQLGIDLKLSLLYKLPLTILVLILVLFMDVRYFLGLCGLLFLLLLGPVCQLIMNTNSALFINDFSNVYKIIMPIAIFIYFGLLSMRWKSFSAKWLERILISNFAILCFNLMLGALGLGRSSYQLRDDETAGSNGFIYAANELGATMVVLFSFMLHMCWNYHRRWYPVLALFTVLCGLLVATKTAMLAAMLLVFVIPLANERENFFKITALKLYIVVPMMVSVGFIAFIINDLLQALGLYDRFMWVLSQKGVLGIILSGRDEYARQLFVVYIDYLDFWQQAVGVGSAGIAEFLPIKYSAEIDFIDVLAYFGFLGLIICFCFYFLTFVKAAMLFTKYNAVYSPSVVVGTFILLFLAQLSGHVWISGTLGVSLGCFVSLLWVDNEKRSNS
ncbi:O-antigen ligase family protein [Pseudoalteromonas xiamenensis]|uniref:O-antigen ligase family protein n=1 Tax=Pseudoalteromonas xiamenensis TaxID=882626 RepID=UPI0027E525D7|nr:O-antigen ligase family protein [Pseudoalteromonas xiamenensis]WMN61196.1 O-antigen ligase family protein [Pseudoalteromonas xiamenensis]